jgi:hypothetical protein
MSLREKSKKKAASEKSGALMLRKVRAADRP